MIAYAFSDVILLPLIFTDQHSTYLIQNTDFPKNNQYVRFGFAGVAMRLLLLTHTLFYGMNSSNIQIFHRFRMRLDELFAR